MKPAPEIIDQVLKLRAEGVSATNIGRTVGISTDAVYKIINPPKAEFVRGTSTPVVSDLYISLSQLALAIEPLTPRSKEFRKRLIQLISLGLAAHKKVYGPTETKALIHDLLTRLK